MITDGLLNTVRELLATGPTSEEDLVRRVYGVAGSTGPWLPLLRRMLEHHEGFERAGDGRWALKDLGSPPVPVLLAGRQTRARSAPGCPRRRSCRQPASRVAVALLPAEPGPLLPGYAAGGR